MIVNVWAALVSVAPFAVPPLSWMLTLTVAMPVASAADAKVSVPSALTAGCTANSALLEFVTMKSTSWSVSPVPWLIAVAQPAIVWAAEVRADHLVGLPW